MLRRLRPYWFPARYETAAGAILLALASAFELLQPWPIKGLVDYVFGEIEPPQWLGAIWPPFRTGDTFGMIAGVCVAILVLAVISRVTYLSGQHLLIRAGGRVVKKLRCDACDHLYGLSLTYHDTTKVGDSIYRVAYDATAALTLIAQVVAPVASGMFVLLGSIVILLRVDPTLTAVAVVVVPVFWFTIRAFSHTIEQRSKHYHESESRLVSALQESLSSIRAVQAFSREPQTSALIHDQAERSLSANRRLVFAQLAFSACVAVAMAVGTAAVVALGAQRVASGILSLGDVLVFLAYLGMLYQPMNALSQSSTVLHSVRTQLNRVFEVLETPLQIRDRPDAQSLSGVRGQIKLRNVSFAYEPDRPVLNNVNLIIEPGQVVALVGRTGAGKTTLASLLLRFYDPTSGDVLVDGHDLRDIRLTSLREHVAVVLQDAILFSATIADNIAYAKSSATRAEIEQAASLAQIDDFIRNLPNGYDTMLGERGVNLSGGQRQRIALARAFLKDAPVLILDEPTSSVDGQTEDALMEALKTLTAGRTTVIISHRLSTVRLADKVVVLEGQHIVEQGTHDELMRTDTAYRRLYVSQWMPENSSERPGRSDTESGAPIISEGVS
jgi:ATP-binding cassette subfamily B protein/subfamily B ATP-binding cassette protein MsbA